MLQCTQRMTVMGASTISQPKNAPTRCCLGLAKAAHLQVLPHGGQIRHHVNAHVLEVPAGADAAQLQHLRRVHRAGRHQHLAALAQLGCSEQKEVKISSHSSSHFVCLNKT